MNAFSKFSKEELIELLKNSESVTDVLRKVGLSTNGSGTRTTLKRVCKQFEISDLYINLKNQGIHFYKTESYTTLSLEEMLIENSSVSRNSLKKRLLKEGIIKNKCSECGLEEWNGKQITMILDHVNGINNDNRLENLRMLCPNCNSQQETFAGRNTKKVKRCPECGKEHFEKTIYCSKECKKSVLDRNRVISNKTADKRFWTKVDIKEKNECWNWTFSIDPSGYGSGIRYNGKKYNSHKMAWILTYGEVPKGMWVLHNCKNRKCCNPSHLYLGTRSERMMLAVKEGTAGILRIKRHSPAKGEKNGNHILFEKDIVEIRKLITAGIKLSEIAEIYKVNRQTISDIKYNKSWKNIGV